MGSTVKRLRDAVNLIRTLNPKPASVFGVDPADDKRQHIVPDFYVETDGENLTLSLLNTIPELQIEETFRLTDDDERGMTPDSEASLFVKQKRGEAEELIQVLKMRQTTLFRTMSAILRLQRDFFINGDDESLIHPMILKDVAAITHDDLSVISRATSGKYVATQGGVFPLKMFFREHPKDESDIPARDAMAVIRELVDAEDKSRPLSDEAIMASLSERGFPIARRTVAKYRERLGIPVARLRREI